MRTLREAPLVVGCIRPEGLQALTDLPSAQRGADVIEARFDLAMPKDDPAKLAALPAAALPDLAPYLATCARLQETGSPVIGTIRMIPDGGRWPFDRERLPWFEKMLPVVSMVDVEVQSEITPAVIRAAHASGRKVVVSHHEFARTPEAGELDAVVGRAQDLGADIVKIATMVQGIGDHDRLLGLMRRTRLREHVGLAVVGMGPFGTPLRAYLPTIGSRLTYGYLDETAAPGQLPARELVQRLTRDCPIYADFRRGQGA